MPHPSTDGATAPSRRVLIVVQNLPVPFDRRVWLEASTLAQAGCSVSVICPKMKGYNASRERLEGIEIYRYPCSPTRRAPSASWASSPGASS